MKKRPNQGEVLVLNLVLVGLYNIIIYYTSSSTKTIIEKDINLDLGLIYLQYTFEIIKKMGNTSDLRYH